MLALLGAVPAVLSSPRLARAESLKEAHGLAIFDDLKYPADFPHFDYVNVDAPIGGTLSHSPGEWTLNQNPLTFNTLNTFILRGDAPLEMDLTFASLMVRAYDEPDAIYGLAAKSVRHDSTKKYFEFRLHEGLTFHDGSPLTAEDVVFSIEAIKKEGHPLLASSLLQVEEIKLLSKETLSVRLSPNAPRDVIFALAADVPILSKAYYTKVKFSDVTMTPALGSGPFKVGRFSQGRFIEYERVKDWWGFHRAAMRGQFNWSKIRIDCFRDYNVAFEAFKAGEYLLREEFSSRLWATGYDFPAIKSGAVTQLSLPDGRPSGMQGFFINMRRDKFQDPRVRKAIALAFDFEWANSNLFYKQYTRTQSVFQNSPLMANGMPSAEELVLLEPYRNRLPPEVFDEAQLVPVSDGSGSDRKQLREALRLLSDASVKVTAKGAMLPGNEPFKFEFLNDDPQFEKIILPYIRNLGALGIAATLRTVDPAQYQARINTYDFDLVSRRYSLNTTPGDGLRRMFSSKDAEVPGSYNLAGIRHPVVDALIEKVIAAGNREALQTACHALDRVLRCLDFWVPQWYRPSHLLAYWDIYRQPPVKPPYARGVVETWWLDEKQAKKLGKGL